MDEQEQKDMNKAELITALAAKADLTKDRSAAALSALLATITEPLTVGDKVAMNTLYYFLG